VKQKTRTVIFSTILIAALVVGAFDVATLLGTFDIDRYTAKALELFEDAKIRFEQIRNVTLTDDINLHVLTKQQAKERWGQPSGEQDLTNLYRLEKIYKGLFMMPEGDTLVQAVGEWTANWVAATVGDHDIYVIKENFNPFHEDAETTLIHELTHIWQPDLTEPTTYNEDKAHAALVEGDSRFMEAYFRNLTKTENSPLRFSVRLPFYLLDNPLLEDVYPMANALWSLNFFPYDKGEVFVNALYDEGGFATINQAYVAGYTPSSTAQILHTEKYFANESTQQVQAPTLGETSWTLVQSDRKQDHNTYGEYFIQAMLDTWLEEAPSQEAAAGWAGDNFTYYERGSDFLYTWNIKWSSKAEASEFYSAFQTMMGKTDATGEGSDIWLANGRYLMMDWNQNADSTLISVSTVQSAAQQSYFS
jgi:hypothetical protein